MSAKPCTARSQAATGAGRRPASEVFRVESVEPYGWIVYRDGEAETRLFRSRPLALAHACARARSLPPSVVLLSNIAGHIERYREYPQPPDAPKPL